MYLYWFILLFSYFFILVQYLGQLLCSALEIKWKCTMKRNSLNCECACSHPLCRMPGSSWAPDAQFLDFATVRSHHLATSAASGASQTHTQIHTHTCTKHKIVDWCMLFHYFFVFQVLYGYVFFSYKCSCLWSIVSFYLVLFVFVVFFFLPVLFSSCSKQNNGLNASLCQTYSISKRITIDSL